MKGVKQTLARKIDILRLALPVWSVNNQRRLPRVQLCGMEKDYQTHNGPTDPLRAPVSLTDFHCRSVFAFNEHPNGLHSGLHSKSLVFGGGGGSGGDISINF